MIITCSYCGVKADKPNGAVNRANKKGLNIYCSKKCSGIGRRLNKTTEQKKLEKREYDKQYREKNKDSIKKKKQEYFKKDYTNNPIKYKEIRKRKYKYHLAYLSTPEYKKYKKDYDRKYLAKKNYGEFWESKLILMNIENEIPNREVKYQNGITNKSQIRKRKIK